MPASQTRSVSYRIGEAASGGMGAISQPANQSESGPGHERRFRYLRGTSAYPPRLAVKANIWNRQLRAMTGLMRCSKTASSFDQVVHGTGTGHSRNGTLWNFGGLDVRLGGGATTIRDFLVAGLVDHLHVVVSPILLGRGERVWDGLEGLEEHYDIEATSSPSGVTHMTFARRES